MIRAVDEMNADLEALALHRDRLADQLETAASLIEESGSRPPSELMEELAVYRRTFQQAAVDLDLLDRELIDGPVPDLSIDDLHRRMRWHGQVSAAIGVLEKASRLQRIDDRHSEELAAILDEVSTLKQRLTASADIDPRAVNELSGGRHPLCGLLSFVRDQHALANEEWFSRFESVCETYGQPLAVAAARGHLTCDDFESHERGFRGFEYGVNKHE